MKAHYSNTSEWPTYSDKEKEAKHYYHYALAFLQWRKCKKVLDYSKQILTSYFMSAIISNISYNLRYSYKVWNKIHNDIFGYKNQKSSFTA